MTRAGLFIPGLLVSQCVLAAGVPDENLQNLLPLSLDELMATPVVTASRPQEARERVPAHIMVFTRDQIRDRRYRTLADLMEDLPGVDFQRGTRSAQFNHFAFQGHLSNNKLLILLDGVRVDQPAGGKIPVADNFSLHFVRQVEVLYGPAAALYGADAMAGVINIITERPHGELQGQVDLTTGRFGTWQQDYQASSELLGGWALSVSGHRQASERAPLDEYYPGSYPQVAAGGVAATDREDYASGISSDSQFLRLDHADNLTLGYYSNHFRSLTSTGDAPEAVFYLPGAYYDSRIETLYGKYRLALAPGLKGELVVDQSTYEVDPRSRYINYTTGFQDDGYDYTWARRQEIEQSLDWQLSERHSLLAGIGYHRYRAIETPDLPQPYDTSESPSRQYMTYVGTSLPLQVFEADYHNWSEYLQWQARWSDDFSTMLGVRNDYYSTYGRSLNPRLGAIWRLDARNYLKLLYGEAFRTPSPEEVYSAFGTFNAKPNGRGVYAGLGFRAPNTGLVPEESHSLSLTWDWRPRHDFNLTTNTYMTRVENVINTQSADTDTVCPFDSSLYLGSNQYIPRAILCNSTSKANAGEDEYWGLDVIPQWQSWLGNGWGADSWASYSFIRGLTQDASGRLVREQINLASHKLKLGVTFRYQDWLTITPRLQWIGPTTTGRAVSSGSGDRITTDSYVQMSLHGGLHKLGIPGLSLYLDIYNLTDERYYAAHTSSSSAVLLEVPQQPRTWLGTLEYRF